VTPRQRALDTLARIVLDAYRPNDDETQATR
jgi:hypothetical protein